MKEHVLNYIRQVLLNYTSYYKPQIEAGNFEFLPWHSRQLKNLETRLSVPPVSNHGKQERLLTVSIEVSALKSLLSPDRTAMILGFSKTQEVEEYAS